MDRLQRYASMLLLVTTGLLLAHCGSESAPPPDAAPATLPFIQDDYSQALAQARQANVPLFIETWAPW